MIKLEMWGVVRKEYGPVFEKKTEVSNVTPKQVYYLLLEELQSHDLVGWVKVFINGKFVASRWFIEQYARTHQPNKFKVYFELHTGHYVVFDTVTQRDVYKGTMEEVERWLDVHNP